MKNTTLFLFIFCCAVSSANFSPSPVRSPEFEGGGKYFALFFAIQDYDHWNNLRNPIKDAQTLAKELEDSYGFQTEVVTNPSKNEIYSKLKDYRQRSYSKDAELFIFFSGHGDYTEETQEGFIIPKDGLLEDEFQDSYIPHSRLEKSINRIPCQHILLAIDACFSGTFDEKISLSKGKLGMRPGSKMSLRQVFIEQRLKHKSRLYLTSGGKERTPDGQEHSPFTEKFLLALRNYGGDDGLLTFSELCTYMEKAVPTPRAGEFGSHKVGGSFIFISQAWNGSAVPSKGPPPTNKTNTSETSEAKLIGTTLLDNRDKQTYPTIRVFGKIWMAQNLNFDIGIGSWCYDNKAENCKKEGRLYSWVAAKQACPKGWRLPSEAEWTDFANLYGELSVDSSPAIFKALIKGGEANFNVQLTGLRQSGLFGWKGLVCGFWSSTELDDNAAWHIIFSKYQDGVLPRVGVGYPSKQNAYSCRCIKE